MVVGCGVTKKGKSEMNIITETTSVQANNRETPQMVRSGDEKNPRCRNTRKGKKEAKHMATGCM